jgi:hypothetical protein
MPLAHFCGMGKVGQDTVEDKIGGKEELDVERAALNDMELSGAGADFKSFKFE